MSTDLQQRESIECADQTLGRRLTAGLSKISLALRTRAWREADRRGISPTQAQILSVLLNRGGPSGMTLSQLAESLAITPPTASDAVSALVRKRLIRRSRQSADARFVNLRLTPAGRREAELTASWPDFLLGAIDTLSPGEQAVFLRGLIKMVRQLQLSGAIPVSRLCVTCRFFRPGVYPDRERPNHCDFVNAPFGDRQLRLDCPDHETASLEESARLWEAFNHPPAAAAETGERIPG